MQLEEICRTTRGICPEALGVCIGSKADLKDCRQVNTEEAREWASSNGLKYWETSAHWDRAEGTGPVFDEIVQSLIEMIGDRRYSRQSNPRKGRLSVGHPGRCFCC